MRIYGLCTIIYPPPAKYAMKPAFTLTTAIAVLCTCMVVWLSDTLPRTDAQNRPSTPEIMMLAAIPQRRIAREKQTSVLEAVSPATVLTETAGFTLIELSIVLVIIGLIVGGILTGRDLINAAAQRAQIAQIDKYNTAVNTFDLKYGYLPGDIPNPYASQFGFQTRGQYAGEGDGNGIIEGVYQNAASRNAGFYGETGETATFWVDLSTAGLIDGGFTTATPSTIGSNVSGSGLSAYMPAAKIGGGNYIYVWSGGEVSDGSGATASNGINYFGLGVVTGLISNAITENSTSLSVNQAYNIDKKMDDGYPLTGYVTATFLNGFGNYWVGQVPAHATWQTPGSAITCYDNNNTLNDVQAYSTAQNNGNGVNCALSFQLQ